VFILTVISRLFCYGVSMKPSRVGTPSQIMTLAEVATHLRVHKTTIYRLIHGRQLPVFKIGSDYRFDREAIEKWMVEQQSKGGARPR
jgi:excisionase family DNA binding protein